MHAVSQGALGIECRRDDTFMIRMLNGLNHEETLIRCIAERTFLAALEGGCSAPVGVFSSVNESSISLEGIVLDLDGTQAIKDRFEMDFNSDYCPITNMYSPKLPEPNQWQTNEKTANDLNDDKEANEKNSDSSHEVISTAYDATRKSLKHHLNEDTEEEILDGHASSTQLLSNTSKRLKSSSAATQTVAANIYQHYSFILDLNISQNKMMKAELCGLHLAEKLKEKGADILIKEIKAQVHRN
jgi:hypothetical protein